MTQQALAPHGLELVVDFVNTLDIESGSDRLSAPGDLGDWLAERGLLESPAPLAAADLRAAAQLREALRSAMLAHNGGPQDDSADLRLEAVARRGDLGVRFLAGGSVQLAPQAEGFEGALAALLVPVAQAIADGSWKRVKACRAPDCHWAFYDRSRNRSGTWCEMAVCGNRTKVRAYRERTPRAGRRAR